jgi:hypothetical protein
MARITGFAGGAFINVNQGGGDSPDQFHFETRFNATISTQYVSSTAMLSGLVGTAQSVVSGGEQSLNGAAFTSGAVTVENGDELRLRRNASSAAATQVSVTATIGSTVGTFVIVTAAAAAARASWRRRAAFAATRRVA